jgi:hypothetical protein
VKKARRAEERQMMFDGPTRMIAGGLAALTSAAAITAGAKSATPNPDLEPATPGDKNFLVVTGQPATLRESLAANGFRLLNTPPSLRISWLEVQTREPAASMAREDLRVPRTRLVQGMGKKAPREDVRALQLVLKKVGFFPAKRAASGIYGPVTTKAVKQLQLTLRLMGKKVPINGKFGAKTQRALAHAFQTRKGRRALIKAHKDVRKWTRYSPGAQYKPGSREAKRLFRAAARLAGLPERWASSPALHNILRSESNGVVGVPNYTYGSRRDHKSQWDDIHRELKRGVITAVSSATGLGQLLSYNVETYYPAGLKGIGVPVQEAAGMLRYIASRYGSPENAWRLYNTLHEGY